MQAAQHRVLGTPTVDLGKGLYSRSANSIGRVGVVRQWDDGANRKAEAPTSRITRSWSVVPDKRHRRLRDLECCIRGARQRIVAGPAHAIGTPQQATPPIRTFKRISLYVNRMAKLAKANHHRHAASRERPPCSECRCFYPQSAARQRSIPSPDAGMTRGLDEAARCHDGVCERIGVLAAAAATVAVR